ncbi:hypothetical protein BGZ58_005405, partial [Dissophora ornata]
MTTLAFKKTIGAVLSVVSSFPTDDPANNTASAEISDDDGRIWKLRLSRQGNILTLHAGPKDDEQDHPEYSNFSDPPPVSCQDNLGAHWVARLVPHKNPRLSKPLFLDTEKFTCGGTIEVNKVLHNGRFCFDIVLTFGDSPIDAPKRVEATSKIYDIMKVLLKDIYSVDVCFVFGSDKTYSNA